MAGSDHCRWVWTPRWVRASWKVTSTCQRRTWMARICSTVIALSVLNKACGSRWPCGQDPPYGRAGSLPQCGFGEDHKLQSPYQTGKCSAEPCHGFRSIWPHGCSHVKGPRRTAPGAFHSIWRCRRFSLGPSPQGARPSAVALAGHLARSISTPTLAASENTSSLSTRTRTAATSSSSRHSAAMRSASVSTRLTCPDAASFRSLQITSS